MLVRLLLLSSASAAATISAGSRVNKSQLDGIFVDLTAVTSNWTESQWKADIQSMKDVGMTFFVVHHTATGTANISAECPAGTYGTYFRMDGPCFAPIAGPPGGAIGVIIKAAAAVGGMKVHLGLAEQRHLGPIVNGKVHNALYGEYANVTALQHFRSAQSTMARSLWAAFGSSGLISGFCTRSMQSLYVVPMQLLCESLCRTADAYLEEPQNFASALPDWPRLATNYYQPLAQYVKHELSQALVVWNSPDAVGNWSRYPRYDMLGARLIGDLWEQMFVMAPDFDFVALQDSQGERGQNSLADTAAFLGNTSEAAARQDRAMWSNVELFQAWPDTCHWARATGHCHGRAPAPMDRIIGQIELAAKTLAKAHPYGDSSGETFAKGYQIIAWEWTSCLSPHGGTGQLNITALARANYEAYAQYVNGE